MQARCADGPGFRHNGRAPQRVELEDILLERQARETNYAFDLSIGFSYRFGSKFNNVVNPRMGGSGGEEYEHH